MKEAVASGALFAVDTRHQCENCGSRNTTKSSKRDYHQKVCIFWHCLSCGHWEPIEDEPSDLEIALRRSLMARRGSR